MMIQRDFRWTLPNADDSRAVMVVWTGSAEVQLYWCAAYEDGLAVDNWLDEFGAVILDSGTEQMPERWTFGDIERYVFSMIKQWAAEFAAAEAEELAGQELAALIIAAQEED